MQARGVSASLCYPSTSAICTWARTWLAAPGPPWKWGGGSVASAGPAPRHEFDEPVIAMLPRVLYVYWGMYCVCVSVCVCARARQDTHSNHAQTARLHSCVLRLLPLSKNSVRTPAH